MFRKDMYDPNVVIGVGFCGEAYEFPFPKRLTEAGAKASSEFVKLKEGSSDEEARKALVNAVSEMINGEPTGFDDFPADDGRPLAERAREYFDDPEHPELESILVAAWRAYTTASQPRAYLASPNATKAREGKSSAGDGAAT